MKFIVGIFRFFFSLAIIAACGYFVYTFMQKQEERNEYNSVIEMINKGDLEAAVPKLKEFMNSSDSSVVSNARMELTKVYKRLGDDPGRPTKESAEFYRKAAAIDPDCLEESQKRLLEADRKMQLMQKKQ